MSDRPVVMGAVTRDIAVRPTQSRILDWSPEEGVHPVGVENTVEVVLDSHSNISIVAVLSEQAAVELIDALREALS